jgi:hypothetical protein
MSNTTFSKTKLNVKKSNWLKKSIIGASVLSLMAGLGFGVYRAAETDPTPTRSHRSSGVSHNESASHLPVFAQKTRRPHSKKLEVTNKSKKQSVAKGKKHSKKLAAAKHKKHPKIAAKSKHKKANFSKLNQKQHKLGKHSKHVAKHKKGKKTSKHLAAK